MRPCFAERDRYEGYWAVLLDTLKVKGYIRPEVDLDMLRLIGLGSAELGGHRYREGGRWYQRTDWRDGLDGTLCRAFCCPTRSGRDTVLTAQVLLNP